MLGVAQITLGVVINVLSLGALGPIGNGLIAEGVGDIIFAIQTGEYFCFFSHTQLKNINPSSNINVTVGTDNCHSRA